MKDFKQIIAEEIEKATDIKSEQILSNIRTKKISSSNCRRNKTKNRTRIRKQ